VALRCCRPRVQSSDGQGKGPTLAAFHAMPTHEAMPKVREGAPNACASRRCLGRAREAIPELRTIPSADPFNITFLNGLAEAFAAEGQWATCFQEMCSLAKYSPRSASQAFEMQAERAGVSDRPWELPELDRGRPLPLYGLAQFHLMCGDEMRAAGLMEEALKERHMMVARNLGWKLWRANPRWSSLARALNLPG
jgi:hypothetical protein